MKIYLDLLPAERKKELKRKKIFRTVLRQEILLLAPVFVLLIILANIYYLLSLQQQTSMSSQAMTRSQDKYQQLSTYEDKFKEVNTQTAALLKIQTGHLHWSNIFAKMDSLTPEGITITNFSTKDYMIFLVGKAKNRDILLSYKNKLESGDCFSDINVPLSNLVVKEDIDFQIDFSVKKDCLIK